MSTFTAQILIGSPHTYDGGIIPSNYLFLSENSRPAWVLVPENVFNENTENYKITWIPTIESMLEDAILMIAIHVAKDPEVIALAEKYFKDYNKNWIELYSINQDELKSLHEKCRQIKNFPKLVITVLEGSTIRNQLNKIDSYNFEADVCTIK